MPTRDRPDKFVGSELLLPDRELKVAGKKEPGMGIAVPLLCEEIRFEYDLTKWLGDSDIRVTLQMSEDNGKSWVDHCGITASRSKLSDEDICGVGVKFVGKTGNAVDGLLMRDVVETEKGEVLALAAKVIWR